MPATLSAIDALAEKWNAMPKPTVDLKALRENAGKWAEECGLQNVSVSEATKENYPKYGYGFAFSVRGQTRSAKSAMATARYSYKGERSYWSMDGMVTG